MKIETIFFAFLIFFFGCDNNKFDSEIWKRKEADWWMSDFREKMIDDLIQSDTLIGLNKKEIIDLLGQSEISVGQKMQYLIREKYSIDIDPEYIKHLVINLDTNGISFNCEIKSKK